MDQRQRTSRALEESVVLLSRMSALAVSMQHLHFSFATHYEAPRFNADFQLVGRKTWHLGTEKDCFAGVFQVVAARMEKLGFSLQPIVHISTVYAATPFEDFIGATK